jgi:biotin carboxylase
MSRVLLFDTNVSSAPILQYLEGAGHEVHVVGRNPEDYLARTASNYINLDYADADAALALVGSTGAEFIVPGCNDISYQTCAQIAAKRPFPGIDGLAVTRTIMLKQDFRAYADRNGIPAPRAIAEGADVNGRSVVVKPVDAYSGRGVTALKAASKPALDAAASLAKEYSQSGRYIVEDYVQGQLYSHTAFVDDTGVVADFIVEEHGSVNPFTVDTSRVVHDFDADLLGQVRGAITQMARDLQLRPGLIHTQFITDGTAYWIIEITRRCPGDLYSLLISLSTGFDYAENYVRPFLGEPFKIERGADLPVMRHTISLREDQRFEALQFHRPLAIERYVALAQSGDHIRPSPFGRVGILFAGAASIGDLDALMQTTVEGRLYSVLGQAIAA